MAKLPDDLSDELIRILGDEHVRYTPAALRELGVELCDGDAAAWWLHPSSAAEVAEVIRVAARHAVAVIPIGNVTQAPRAASLRTRPCFFVDSRRMNHVLHLDETSLVVHVQAGLTAYDLEKVLAPRGLSLGDYPPASLNATLGGLLAVRTPGKASRRHGFLEDAVLGLSAVIADGRTVHTRVAPKRATGPDLARALCGSEGTLGFITSIVLRIHRRPESRLLDAHVMPSLEAALDAVKLALREDAMPSAMRVYDGAEARAHLGAQVCRPGEAVLVVATAGPTDLAAVDRDLIASAANAQGGRSLGTEPAEIWWRRRKGHGLAVPIPAALQVAARPGKQAPCYRAVLAAAQSAGVRARAHVSRFDADGAVLFFAFTQQDLVTVLNKDTLAKVTTAAAKAAETAGGFLLGHTIPEINPYFHDLRHELDPNDIMNPAALA